MKCTYCLKKNFIVFNYTNLHNLTKIYLKQGIYITVRHRIVQDDAARVILFLRKDEPSLYTNITNYIHWKQFNAIEGLHFFYCMIRYLSRAIKISKKLCIANFSLEKNNLIFD